MEFYKNIKEKELNSFIRCSSLNEINRIQRDGIETYLNKRIVRFLEINREDLSFINTFFDVFATNNNPILKTILNNSCKTQVCLILETFWRKIKNLLKLYIK